MFPVELLPDQKLTRPTERHLRILKFLPDESIEKSEVSADRERRRQQMHSHC